MTPERRHVAGLRGPNGQSRQHAGALQDASAPSDVPENAKRHAQALQSSNLRYEAVPFVEDSAEWLLNRPAKKDAKGVDSPNVRL